MKISWIVSFGLLSLVVVVQLPIRDRRRIQSSLLLPSSTVLLQHFLQASSEKCGNFIDKPFWAMYSCGVSS